MAKINSSDIDREELFAFVAGKVTEVLKQHGINRATTATVSLAVSDGLAKEFGGQSIYFHKDRTGTTIEKHLAIRANFKTGNYTHGQLARKYGLTKQRIYGILKDES